MVVPNGATTFIFYSPNTLMSLETPRIILLGPPASGKGTQARQLAAHLEVSCLGTGSLLRSEIKKDTPLGQQAKMHIDRGFYVPDELILGMVEKWLGEHQEGWLLDGFPRTLPQAKALQEIAAPICAIQLDVPREVLENRISSRRECNTCGFTTSVTSEDEQGCPTCETGVLVARKDDAIESFRVRYENYSELTVPLYDYYQSKGVLYKVDGTLSPEQVFESILTIVNSL